MSDAIPTPEPAHATAPRVAALSPTTLAPPVGTPASRALGRRALAAALTLGVLGDTLLREAWGINFVVCTAALVAALAWLARRRGQPVTLGAAALGALALAFASAFAVRDGERLLVLNVLGLWSVLCALAAALLHGDTLPLERAGPLDYAVGAARVAWRTASGAPRLAFDEARVQELSTVRARSGAATFVRGALLAAPALLVFGALFAAADATFGALVDRLFGWDVENLVGHALGIAVLTWAAAGYLHASLVGRRDAAGTRGVGGVGAALRETIGAREVCVAIALVDALFATFVVLQLGWLFGGEPVIAAGSTSYAEYARRGFFELVTAAALALPALLLAHARVAADAASSAPGVRRAFRLAGGALVGLVLVVMLSAADRMRLYVGAYGLTEARFYAAAFMGWLGVVFAWAAVALLRDRPASFALGTLVTAWAWILVLDVANPDARVVEVNVRRLAAGERFDAQYVTTLSADAAPSLAEHALPLLLARGRADDACAVAQAIRRRAYRQDERAAELPLHDDWRSWSVARARVRDAARTSRADAARACANVPRDRQPRPLTPPPAPPAPVAPVAQPQMR